MNHSGEENSSGLHDGELLARFLERKSEDSFAELVRRHGGMVMGVCRSVLGGGGSGGGGGGGGDAEDAAQAVFLTLAQRARSLKGRRTLAGWLHRVAWYVAMRAREAAAIRRRHEMEAARMGKDTGLDGNAGSLEIPSEELHGALEKLPEKYRLALLLHHVEGRTEAETAALLGCSASAASVRLSRGREMLRVRLAGREGAGGRGVGQAAATAAVLSVKPPMGMPPALVAAIAHSAHAVVAGQAAAASASSLALSKGAMKMLFWAHAKFAATIAITSVVLVGSAATYVAVAQGGRGSDAQIASGSPQPTSPAAASYVLTKLGTFGGKRSVAGGINSQGQVVGQADLDPSTPEGKSAPGEPPVTHAFLYSGGKMHDLGTLGGKSSAAAGINDAGQIVGEAEIDPAGPGGQPEPGDLPIEHAFLYENGKMRDLGTFGGPRSVASRINAKGQVVGQADRDPSTLAQNEDANRAFLYGKGKMEELAGSGSGARAINDAGQVAGTYSFDDPAGNTLSHLFVFSDGQMQPLDFPPERMSSAFDINSSGQIVGFMALNDLQRGDKTLTPRGFIYSAGERQDLGTFGGETSRALGNNNQGQVVGAADTAAGDSHAFLFEGGQMRDLNILVGEKALTAAGFKALSDARSINQRGQIVGTGKDEQGNTIAYLVTPVQIAATAPATLPFTISKETTAITSPLNPDGTPDYIGAFNQRYSQGVTPDNNGFALWLQIAGNPPSVSPNLVQTPHRDDHIPDPLWAQLVTLTGATNVPKTSPWLYFSDFLEQQKGYSAKAASDKYNEIFLHSVLWTPDQQPDLVDYLNRVGPLLDKTVEAAQRPKWFEPTVSADQWLINQVSPAPTLYQQREAARALLLRALLRAKTGDFDGFMHDAMGVEQLGRASLIEMQFSGIVALSIAKSADIAIDTVVSSGALTLPQCEALSKALAQLPPLGNPTQSVDVLNRWQMLDDYLPVALGRMDVVRKALLGDTVVSNIGDANHRNSMENLIATLESVDRDSVDWDVTLKQMNQTQDQIVAALKIEPLSAMKSRCQEIDQEIAQWRTEIDPSPALLHKRANESREQYSQRLAKALLVASGVESGDPPAVASAMITGEQYYRERTMQHEMLKLLIAAATVHAKTGTWPAKPEDLAPAMLNQLPQDIYSESGTAPVKYILTNQGPRIYSIGPNGIDEGGKLDTATQQDDIAVGPG